MSILGRNHRCKRHLSSQPQPSSPAPMTPAALLSLAPQTANTSLADRTPTTPEPPADPTTTGDRAPGWRPALPAQALRTTQASRANQAASTTPAVQAAPTSAAPAATSVVLTPLQRPPVFSHHHRVGHLHRPNHPGHRPPPHTHRPDPPLRHQPQPKRPTRAKHTRLQLPHAPFHRYLPRTASARPCRLRYADSGQPKSYACLTPSLQQALRRTRPMPRQPSTICSHCQGTS
jgi:hypothetical protein